MPRQTIDHVLVRHYPACLLDRLNVMLAWIGFASALAILLTAVIGLFGRAAIGLLGRFEEDRGIIQLNLSGEPRQSGADLTTLYVQRLSKEELAGLGSLWHRVCDHFAIDPENAISEADTLMADLMEQQGRSLRKVQVPIDLGVRHRMAHAIVEQSKRRIVDHEKLQIAMNTYIVMFDMLFIQ
jgi:hypothetical protein